MYASTDSTRLKQWLRAQQKAFRKGSGAILLLSALRFAVQLAGLYVLSMIIGRAVMESLQPDQQSLAVLATLFTVQLLLSWLVFHVKRGLSHRVLVYFQTQLMQRLQTGSLAVLRQYSAASWQSFIMKRVPALQSFYSDYLPQQQLAAVIPVLVIIAVFPVSWLAALLLAIAAPLIPLFMWLVGKGAAASHQRHYKALERLGSIFLDRLQARQLLHTHRAVNRQKRVFTLASHALREKTLEVLRFAFLSSSVIDFFATVGMALIAVFTGFSLLGEITFGSWQSGLTLQEGLFILLLSPLFFSELKTLARFYHLRAEALGAADVIMDVLESAPVANSQKATSELYFTSLTVPVSGQLILQASELTCRSGDHILLQGASGSGKSTLLESLLGMRTAQAEQMQLLLRSQVAWLTQHAVVLPGSVRENLTLSHEADDDYLLALLDKVELTDWIMQQSSGLDTLMGDYPPMSGGQQQRLALARVLFFNRPVVILDEPTAHLSVPQAERMAQLIRQYLADKTVIWVSHDISADKFFNKRWTIDDNGVVKQHIVRTRLCA